MIRDAAPWLISLHGGHSGEYCDHATGTLREIIETAAAQGFRTYGTAEHAPRYLPEHVFTEEIEMGWDLERLARNFDAYARESARLADEFADRITILRGFETEVVPADRYREITLGLRERYGFDYIVGSVHWVEGIIIDYTQAEFDRAVKQCGGREPFAVRYYETIREMVIALQPEVIAHLDVIRKFTVPESDTDTPAIRTAAARALETIRECGSILDLNTAALRKGLSAPFPAPWLLQMATRDFGIPVCFGDDSHSPKHVGKGIPEAREYLLENGVTTITTLEKHPSGNGRATIPLK